MLGVLAEFCTRSIADWLRFDKQLGTHWRRGSASVPPTSATATEKAVWLLHACAHQLVHARSWSQKRGRDFKPPGR
jgi:hypothetical protein